ncbi:hypothetical protein DITRI_Ditri04bG0051700 [Diplodiscus trichospermus]
MISSSVQHGRGVEAIRVYELMKKMESTLTRMVDILGRPGNLREAEKFINNMSIEPDAFIWRTLLSSCKVHGDVELGRLVVNKVIELEPSHSGAYVTLSNIYADIGAAFLEVKLTGSSEMSETGSSSLMALQV